MSTTSTTISGSAPSLGGDNQPSTKTPTIVVQPIANTNLPPTKDNLTAQVDTITNANPPLGTTVPSTTLVGGKSPPPNPISQGVLNLLFICFLYWVSTKILAFYGISNDIYLVYFMFYVFLYVTSLLLPTDYERFD